MSSSMMGVSLIKADRNCLYLSRVRRFDLPGQDLRRCRAPLR